MGEYTKYYLAHREVETKPEQDYKSTPYTEYYLAHHGVLGMKWGVRRYQNKDGSLTPAGKKHKSENASAKKAVEQKSPEYYLKRLKSLDDGSGDYGDVKREFEDLFVAQGYAKKMALSGLEYKRWLNNPDDKRTENDFSTRKITDEFATKILGNKKSDHAVYMTSELVNHMYDEYTYGGAVLKTSNKSYSNLSKDKQTEVDNRFQNKRADLINKRNAATTSKARDNIQSKIYDLDRDYLGMIHDDSKVPSSLVGKQSVADILKKPTGLKTRAKGVF